MEFCGIREQFGDGSRTYKLANQRPLFYVKDAPPGMTRGSLIADCLEAFGRWSAVCDLIFAPTNDPNAAQFVIYTHQFDGPSGILADCELPAPNIRQQQMRIDPTERWGTQIDLVRVLCHEIGHGIGLQHFDQNVPPPELMNPVYSQTIEGPQAGEIAYVQKLYGLPQTPQTPTPVPPIGDSVDLHVILQKTAAGYGVNVDFTMPDGRWQAQGNAHRIK